MAEIAEEFSSISTQQVNVIFLKPRLNTGVRIMRHKRLKKTFVMPHEELKHLNLRIKDFARTYMKD